MAPYEAGEEQRSDPAVQEEIANASEGGGTDDDDVPERASARRANFPSSVGVSVLVRGEARALDVTLGWGDYTAPEGEGAERASSPRGVAKRTP